MAIRKLTNAAYLATNWQDEVESKNDLKKGLLSISYNISTRSIESNSVIECNGTVYKSDTTTITSNSIENSSYYLYFRDINGVLDFYCSIEIPIWSGTKNGWYGSTNTTWRAILLIIDNQSTVLRHEDLQLGTVSRVNDLFAELCERIDNLSLYFVSNNTKSSTYYIDDISRSSGNTLHTTSIKDMSKISIESSINYIDTAINNLKLYSVSTHMESATYYIDDEPRNISGTPLVFLSNYSYTDVFQYYLWLNIKIDNLKLYSVSTHTPNTTYYIDDQPRG